MVTVASIFLFVCFQPKSNRPIAILKKKNSRSGQWTHLLMNLKEDCILAATQAQGWLSLLWSKANDISLRDLVMLG